MAKYLTVLFGVGLCLTLAPDALPAEAQGFHISRGVNISHWLSQSSTRGQRRQEYFTEKDVAFIAGLGYDHIRLPVDEEQLWDEDIEDFSRPSVLSFFWRKTAAGPRRRPGAAFRRSCAAVRTPHG